MPELPEVETVRMGLEPLLKGMRIQNVVLNRAGLRAPFPADFVNTLTGAHIVGLRRRAKYLLADLSTGHVWLTHLGMSGSFREIEAAASYEPEKHDHVVITLKNGVRLVYNDPRRFGQMDILAKTAENTYPAFKNMGPEPLAAAFTGPALKKRLERKKTPIKQALLDQDTVAGIGNIYACEALFAAGIDPRRPSSLLTGPECQKLAACIRAVLKAALQSGGSTLRNHRKVDGSTGFFQHSFKVYGHKGQKCTGCSCEGKACIETIIQGGRTSFFCPVKQR